MFKTELMSRIRAVSTANLVMALCLIAYVSASITKSVVLQSQGTVKGIGLAVYADAGLILPLTGFQYGLIEPGMDYNNTCWVQNTGNSPVTISMTVSWTPTNASTYMSLTWDRDGYALAVAASVNATVTLHVNATAPGVVFSYQMVISAVG